jgi:putative transposase
VGSYKSGVSRKINRIRQHSADELWQVNYYKHIVRRDPALVAIREYIESDPE